MREMIISELSQAIHDLARGFAHYLPRLIVMLILAFLGFAIAYVVKAILRNILTPNAAMESAYRIYRVEQRDGSLLDAFFVSEDKDAVVVRLPGAPDQRIAKKDIVRTSFLRRSLMPEGLLMGMNDQQVSDLFAYLESLK